VDELTTFELEKGYFDTPAPERQFCVNCNSFSSLDLGRLGERRDECRVLVWKPEGKRQLGRPGEDGRIILRWIFRKWDARVWSGSSWLRIGVGGGHL